MPDNEANRDWPDASISQTWERNGRRYLAVHWRAHGTVVMPFDARPGDLFIERGDPLQGHWQPCAVEPPRGEGEQSVARYHNDARFHDLVRRIQLLLNAGDFDAATFRQAIDLAERLERENALYDAERGGGQ